MNSNIKNIVNSIVDGRTSGLKTRIDSILSEKAVDALEVRRIEIAKGIFTESDLQTNDES